MSNNSPTYPPIIKDILKKYDEKYNAIDTPIEPMIKTITIIKYYYNEQGQTQITYRYCNHKVLDQYNEEINDSNHIGHLNPFRYHGYQYDRETDLYYLKTRYYDPKTGRFISSDHTSFLREDIVNGLNLYAYCGNNPVMNVDPDGTFFFTGTFIAMLVVGAVVGAAVGATASIVTQGISNGWDNISWAQVGWAAGMGAIGGALMMTGLGKGWMATSMMALGAINSAGSQLISSAWDFSSLDVASVLTSAAIGGLVGFAGGGGILSKPAVKTTKKALAIQKQKTKRVMDNLSLRKKPGTAKAQTNRWLAKRTLQFNQSLKNEFGPTLLRKLGASALGYRLHSIRRGLGW